MNDKKYPIGSKVKFIYPNKDKDKLGTIVGHDKDLYSGDMGYLVLIPTSSYNYGNVINGINFTWRCLLSQIELLLPGRNEQLVFNFMY